MARGNQRENARKKNEKKNASKKGGTNLDGTTLQKKKEDDAAKMRLKQAAADAKKAEAPKK
ncbi:hypothetical protein BDW42DRAFT_182171 [Aspergillus taichungensis]|uniref:Small EDRK-rich factor-like N-terminal domain-containing protein n=1 Tax=Aspergillus taichungensis TaxID=482145 RepID=A0A2J5HCJ6_9EURO|nr:hypothetical protein BDW42DRAFT_182171 [Aspergillus taichungensis]